MLHEYHRNILNLSALVLNRPTTVMSNRRKDLENICSNIKSYSRIYFANKKGYIGHFQSVVKLMSPQNLLNKGFAIIKVKGQILNNAEDIDNGTEITIHLANSLIDATVQSKSTYDGNEFNI